MTNTNSDPARWRQHIVSTPDVLSGKPRIDGTRIPVALILGYLAAGKTYDEVISEFPDLKREEDRKSTRLNSSHSQISYAVFCLKKKTSSGTWLPRRSS